MRRIVCGLMLLMGCGPLQATPDAQRLYASLYGDVTPSRTTPTSDTPDTAAWTQAIQASWGKTRSLSALATVQREGVADIKTAINRPQSKGQPRNIPADISLIIKKYADKYTISEALVSALIAQESSFNPRAVSRAGAKGLMQLMPVHTDPQGVDPFDAEQNIRTGMVFLSHLLTKYGDLRLALAAYNAGETAVDKYGAVPPYPETQDYVNRIMAMLGG